MADCGAGLAEMQKSLDLVPESAQCPIIREMMRLDAPTAFRYPEIPAKNNPAMEER
jgi:hypothetical protein